MPRFWLMCFLLTSLSEHVFRAHGSQLLNYVQVRLLSGRGGPLVFAHTFSSVPWSFTELGWAVCADWDSMKCTPFWTSNLTSSWSPPSDTVWRYRLSDPGATITLQLQNQTAPWPAGGLSFSSRLQLDAVIENAGLYVAYVVNDGDRPSQFLEPRVDFVRFALYLETETQILENLDSGRLVAQFDTPDLAFGPDLVSSFVISGNGERDYHLNWTVRRSETYRYDNIQLQVEIQEPRGLRHRATIERPQYKVGSHLSLDFSVYRHNARLTRGYVQYTFPKEAFERAKRLREDPKAAGWLATIDRFVVQYLNALLITVMGILWVRVLVTWWMSSPR
ncbi:membrane protein UL148 [Panine betaherpesvirus 2]|uniref:Membrane protein UL148 n=1 Tax=Panine betaherpesvirus 2 TaxID=188763 RepID=Q8QRY0_9BETA|nr:membrane protein UL148 [Panine betaherpesvirus 2]AAM00759.1 membrane protein UL148 [Panine betaherpesvirus 2]QXV67871.1 membrane protein UL148 [Panine betaherpesvirus 2]